MYIYMYTSPIIRLFSQLEISCLSAIRLQHEYFWSKLCIEAILYSKHGLSASAVKSEIVVFAPNNIPLFVDGL